MHIIQYQKVTDEFTTHELALPTDDGELLGRELCSIGDVTYVAVPDDDAMPGQPNEIVVTTVTLTAELRQAIKSSSPHCRLIKRRAHEMIAALYSIEDQRMIERMAISGASGLQLSAGQKAAIAQFTGVNAKAQVWAAEQYAALGL